MLFQIILIAEEHVRRVFKKKKKRRRQIRWDHDMLVFFYGLLLIFDRHLRTCFMAPHGR